MSSQAKATGFLELNIAGFDQAIKTAKNLFAAAVAGFASYKAIEFFKDGIKDAVDFGKEMQSASRAMGGFDPGKLLLAQKALEKAGMGAEEARGHISDFIKEGRNISEIFGGAENYAKALKSAAQDYGSQAEVLTRSGKALQTVWNTMEAISSKVRTFFMAMTEQFVKPLQIALDYINSIDLSGIGTQFGNAIAKGSNIIIGLIKNGDLWEAAKAGIVYAFYAGIDALTTGLQKATAFFGAAMGSINESFGKSFFGDDMVIVLKNIFKALGEILASAILGAASKMAKAIGLDTKGNELDDQAQSEKNASANHINAAKNIIQDASFTGAAIDTAKAIREGMEASKEFKFGESESGKKAQEAWSKIADKLVKAEETAKAMAVGAGANNKPTEKVLTEFSGSSSKVIADNLAKVGGGGNYLKVGQTLAEKTYAVAARSAKANEEARDAVKQVAKNTTPTNNSPKLPR